MILTAEHHALLSSVQYVSQADSYHEDIHSTAVEHDCTFELGRRVSNNIRDSYVL